MHTSNPPALRCPEGVAELFEGLELVDPGLVPVTDWLHDERQTGAGRPSPLLCGIGRKR